MLQRLLVTAIQCENRFFSFFKKLYLWLAGILITFLCSSKVFATLQRVKPAGKICDVAVWSLWWVYYTCCPEWQSPSLSYYSRFSNCLDILMIVERSSQKLTVWTELRSGHRLRCIHAIKIPCPADISWSWNSFTGPDYLHKMQSWRTISSTVTRRRWGECTRRINNENLGGTPFKNSKAKYNATL